MRPVKECLHLINSQGQDQKRESYNHEGFETKRLKAFNKVFDLLILLVEEFDEKAILG